MKTFVSIVVAGVLSMTLAHAEESAAHACCQREIAKPSCCAKAIPAAAPLSDTSLYQLDSTWTNDSGRSAQLSHLRGKPQIVTMFFASCQFTCPLLVMDMQSIENSLPQHLRGKVGFTLVSFDTERDTPAALAKYREQHHLDSDRWTLLRGKDDDVLELAALLGVKFKKDANGQFVHSNVITLLDAEGNIVKQAQGIGVGKKELSSAIEQLLTTR